ncbi:LysE family translocator [Janthinobacterium sp. B9-8]|uniref:LysE family translocator n=1 Tax=Janthinobacterium sp. B9-8 TaxID=1236179 RepID=UPI00061D1E4C|nr:LysE family translocator [Janthinobacterium sp. B9-8]AMC34861.1 lysine transporter LysE [Janthinobacterium sp. B9-8]
MHLTISMILFSLAMSISPGPANMVIVSSGAKHGFRQTLPFVSGASFGFTLLLIFVGFGFIQLMNAYPIFLTSLSWIGAIFISYMAYKIAFSAPEIALHKVNRPTFLQGFLLQWLNPKAWMACASGVALFSNAHSAKPLIIFILIYFLICYASLSAWALLGDRAAVFLNSRNRVRFFNLTMGGLLMATAAYLIYLQAEAIIR